MSTLCDGWSLLERKKKLHLEREHFTTQNCTKAFCPSKADITFDPFFFERPQKTRNSIIWKTDSKLFWKRDSRHTSPSVEPNFRRFKLIKQWVLFCWSCLLLSLCGCIFVIKKRWLNKSFLFGIVLHKLKNK